MLNTKKIIDECHQSVQSTVATKSILTDKRDTFDNITAIEEPEEIIQIQLNIDKQSSTHKKYIESILDKPLTDKYETTIALTNNYDKPRKLTYHYDTLTVPHRFHSRETPFKKILHERKN